MHCTKIQSAFLYPGFRTDWPQYNFASDEIRSVCSDSVISIQCIYVNRYSIDVSVSMMPRNFLIQQLLTSIKMTRCSAELRLSFGLFVRISKIILISFQTTCMQVWTSDIMFFWCSECKKHLDNMINRFFLDFQDSCRIAWKYDTHVGVKWCQRL